MLLPHGVFALKKFIRNPNWRDENWEQSKSVTLSLPSRGQPGIWSYVKDTENSYILTEQMFEYMSYVAIYFELHMNVASTQLWNEKKSWYGWKEWSIGLTNNLLQMQKVAKMQK